MTGPYREAAIVLAEPAPLPAYAAEFCSACGAALRWSDRSRHPSFSVSVCNGRWSGWFGMRKCHESRPHIHCHHKGCGASWVTAPFDPAARLT